MPNPIDMQHIRLDSPLERGSREYREILRADLQDVVFTDEAKRLAMKYCDLIRGDCRLSTGRIMTQKDFQAYRARVLAMRF